MELPASIWDQLPIVAIFAVLAYLAFKEFRSTLQDVVKQQQDFFAEQRIQDRKILSDLVVQVAEISQVLDEHDNKTDRAIERMEERTRPRSRRKEAV